MKPRRVVLGPAIVVGLGVVMLAGAGVNGSPAASGGRPATAAEARAIVTAYRSSPLGEVNRVPRANYRFVGIRVSKLARSWATARQVPTPAAGATFQPAYGVLVRVATTPRGAGPWVLVDVGSSEVGCAVAPKRVLADLRLSCAPGTGL
jgi:hypothetical protein